MSKEIVILKNDRTGDLFVSLRAINKIINKHKNQEIKIFLSYINHKFEFIFPKIKKNIISMNLSFIEKMKIFFYFLSHNIDTVYILTPKNFYYYLPFFFRKIKFYAITIKSHKSRPNKFLLKYLYKHVELDRLNIKKRKSSYLIQESLIDTSLSQNYLIDRSETNNPFNFPQKFTFFHYKKDLFENILGWDLETTYNFITILSKKNENILFSSELNDKLINHFFFQKFNTYNFESYQTNIINKKNVFFLKNIDGCDLFDVIKKSNKIISPEGIITHIGYYLKKPVLALMSFKLSNRQDLINQIISCKEWSPPQNYNFIVLKKNFDKSIQKLLKRI